MIEVYAALAELRKKHPALVSGALRYLYADDDTLVFSRESKKETLVVLATRGKADGVEIPSDALIGLADAKLVYGAAKLRVSKKSAEFSAKKLGFAVWHLPASA
jgi:glycosidase